MLHVHFFSIVVLNIQSKMLLNCSLKVKFNSIIFVFL